MKDAKIYVGRTATVHSLLFCAHTLCMNYVTETFLLVSSSVSSIVLALSDNLVHNFSVCQ